MEYMLCDTAHIAFAELIAYLDAELVERYGERQAAFQLCPGKCGEYRDSGIVPIDLSMMLIYNKEKFAMAMERTYIMLKPDCVKRGLMGEVIARIERKGYIIADAKMMTLDEAILRDHYAHMKDKPFFPEIVSYMTSGPVFGMIVEGENVVAGMRTLMGATNPNEAAAGTIRGDFANSIRANMIHGSDSAENAEIEIARFFQ